MWIQDPGDITALGGGLVMEEGGGEGGSSWEPFILHNDSNGLRFATATT